MKDQEYNLLGTKIKVKFVDSVYDKDGYWIYGQIEYIGDLDIITISTKNKDGKNLTKQSVYRTLRHELFHAILSKGQYHSCCEDEPLVEWLALCTDLLNNQGLKI